VVDASKSQAIGAPAVWAQPTSKLTLLRFALDFRVTCHPSPFFLLQQQGIYRDEGLHPKIDVGAGSDLQSEMHMAFLMHRLRHEPDSLSTNDVVRMATAGGTEVLGLPAIGTIEVGQNATQFWLTSLSCQPARAHLFSEASSRKSATPVMDISTKAANILGMLSW